VRLPGSSCFDALSEELQEGRALYRSRTEPLLHDLYEREVAGLNAPAAPTPKHAPIAPALPLPSTRDTPTESRGNGLWIALGIAGLLALGLWRLLRPQDW
jgi:hypothetical protein